MSKAAVESTRAWQEGLALGEWDSVLSGIEWDAQIFDAPYSERTHKGHNAANEHAAAAGMFPNKLDYSSFSEDDVRRVVESCSPRTRGWFVTMTDHVLAPCWADLLSDAGRYVFAPIPYVDMGKGPRVLGDGPASWTIQIVVARPRKRAFMGWGSLPGAYLRSKGDVVWSPPSGGKRIGGKPLGVMRAIVRDYSKPGDLVCDPFAGHATTLLAALIEGRRAVGSEVDAIAHAAAALRLSRGYTPDLFTVSPGSESPDEARTLGLPMVGDP